KELAAIYPRRRLISAEERIRLAAEWRAACAESSHDTMRHFAADRVETRPIDSRDTYILSFAGPEWGNAARLVGEAMARTEDAYLSDVFIFWRVRELARLGRLELDPIDAGMRESRVRRVC